MSETNLPINIDLVKNLSPFNDLSDRHVKDILKHATLKSLASGKMLFKRGESPEHCYYLINGAVDLLNESFEITAISSATSPNNNAALHPLDNQQPHQYSAVTTSKSLILIVDKNHMDIVLTWDQAGNYLVTDLSQEDSIERDWMTCLLESSLFSQIPPANIQQLFCTFHQRDVIKDEAIVTEGQQGDHFYALEKGHANVIKQTDDGQHVIASLNTGDFFGEEALVGNTTRNASIVMATNGSLMYLTKDDFKRLLQEPVQDFITLDELEKLQGASLPVVLVDVRLPGEYKFDKLDGSINIPLNRLRERLPTLDSNATYIVLCDGGRRRELGAYLFTEAGFTTKILNKTTNTTH